jgi:hypothetical protein
MNWDAAGAIGEILGAALVVVTLLYLARQVRLNTVATGSSTYQTHMEAWHALSAMIIENPKVADLLLSSEDESAVLDRVDQIRFEFLATKVFGLWEHLHLDANAGLFSKAEAAVWDRYFGDLTNRPGFRSFWESNKAWYFDGFVAHVEGGHAAAPPTSD